MPKFFIFPGNYSYEVGSALKRRSKKWKQLKRKSCDKHDGQFMEKIFKHCAFVWKPTNFSHEV